MPVWNINDGVFTYQTPGMIGTVKLVETAEDKPASFNWAVYYATGSGNPIISGQENSLATAQEKVEYYFCPTNMVPMVTNLIQTILAANFLTDNNLLIKDRKMESTFGHIEVEDYMQVDMINCRHKDEDFCECVCHQPNKSFIMHDRACCNPCVGCGFREKM